MKVLIVGSGGVGQSIATLCKRRDPKGGWLEKMIMADYDLAAAQKISKKLGENRSVTAPPRSMKIARGTPPSAITNPNTRGSLVSCSTSQGVAIRAN